VVVIVALALAVGLSFWLVGWLAARDEVHGFDWELASIFGTAVGTTLLALATGWLAYSTRSEVRATQDLAELTREEQAARERPIVLLQGFRYTPTDTHEGELKVSLLNVGLGTALRVRIHALYIAKTTGESPPIISHAVVTALKPGADTYPALRVRHREEPGTVADYSFQIAGWYLDRSLQVEHPMITDWL
jgi:hypothetical protein